MVPCGRDVSSGKHAKILENAWSWLMTLKRGWPSNIDLFYVHLSHTYLHFCPISAPNAFVGEEFEVPVISLRISPLSLSNLAMAVFCLTLLHQTIDA